MLLLLSLLLLLLLLFLAIMIPQPAVRLQRNLACGGVPFSARQLRNLLNPKP